MDTRRTMTLDEARKSLLLDFHKTRRTGKVSVDPDALYRLLYGSYENEVPKYIIRAAPPDGGLGEPVRSFDETISAWDVVKDHFFPETEGNERVDLQNLKPGDKFFYANRGYGMTTFEEGDDVIEIRDGKLYTQTFDSIGMEWVNGRWMFDGGLGLWTYIVPANDPDALKFMSEEGLGE